jgi:hypothetical protein
MTKVTMALSRRSLAMALAGALLAALPAAAKAAQAPAPGWTIDSLSQPTVFSAAHNAGCEEKGVCDHYVLTATNAGREPTSGGPVTLAVRLPVEEGLELAPRSVSGVELDTTGERPLACTEAPLACRYEGAVPAGGMLRVEVGVTVRAAASSSPAAGSATVEGGGAPPVSTEVGVVVGKEPPFEIANFDFDVTGAAGVPDTLAGDHPYALTSSFDLTSKIGSELEAPVQPVQEIKDAVVELPPGLVGDPMAAERCLVVDLTNGGGSTGATFTTCPPGSRVGTVTMNLRGILTAYSTLGAKSNVSAIYNLVPEHGFPAEFGFSFLGHGVVMYAKLVPTPAGYGLRVMVPGIIRTPLSTIVGVSLTFFGDPHEADGSEEGPEAFFTNPVDCAAEQLRATMYADAWTEPGPWETRGIVSNGAVGPESEPMLESPRWAKMESVTYPRLTGCEGLRFDPELELSPQTTQADAPSGYRVTLKVPQEPNVAPHQATPELKDARVTLPESVVVSPGEAHGLGACAPEQIDLGSAARGHCPGDSTLGSVKVITPLLKEPLTGNVYLAQPQCGECTDADAAAGRLIRLYIEAEGEGENEAKTEEEAARPNVKLAGTVSVNPGNGRLTATFENNPQLPFSELVLDFNRETESGEPRAALANPQTCEPAPMASDLSPWSAPYTPDATPPLPSETPFEATGCGAGWPFAPAFDAGTTGTRAGAFAPFTLTFSRRDGEQDLSRIQVRMPPGLLAAIASVPLCEPQPPVESCPETSKIGAATVAAGSGSHPLWLSGQVYLTGPYEGAPFGLLVAVPAVAGPFNLGTVTVRSAISVDPNTAAVTVTSDPLPQIVDGVPTRVKTLNVTVDRPSFMLNPTDCARTQIGANVFSAQGADVQAASPFAAGGCRSLPFRPTFKVSTRGSTSKQNGASLEVSVAQKPGEANIGKVDVRLPTQLPARLTTLQQACTEQQFAADPADCPIGSFVGYAVAQTPILSGQLRGPAILVSHGGAAFPDLVIILQGEGVTIDLTGHTQIKNGSTYSRFETVPDAPVESFQLKLPEGGHSILSANGNLCRPTKTVTVKRRVTVRRHGHRRKIARRVTRKRRVALEMPTTIEGQNGAVVEQGTKIAVKGCPKKATRHRHSRKKRAGKASRAARNSLVQDRRRGGVR